MANYVAKVVRSRSDLVMFIWLTKVENARNSVDLELSHDNTPRIVCYGFSKCIYKFIKQKYTIDSSSYMKRWVLNEKAAANGQASKSDHYKSTRAGA